MTIRVRLHYPRTTSFTLRPSILISSITSSEKQSKMGEFPLSMCPWTKTWQIYSQNHFQRQNSTILLNCWDLSRSSDVCEFADGTCAAWGGVLRDLSMTHPIISISLFYFSYFIWMLLLYSVVTYIWLCKSFMSHLLTWSLDIHKPQVAAK